MSTEQIRAVSLFSGGLDSTLAIRIVSDQGVAVTALHIQTGFSYVERNRVAGRGATGGLSDIEGSAAALGVPLEIVDVSSAYLPLVLNPRYGYGSGMNPCVDCRIFLLREAKAWMEEHGDHFVFTGEVVGQRPKSQMRPTLRTVARESGLRGYLLRPLSARLLEPTVPELRGWVDRGKLCDISGRGRRRQIALAEQYGITEYAQPSGGCCFLIDQSYSRRLRDFLSNEGPERLNPAQAQVLAVGRHLRLPSGSKVVVGRHERENGYLESCEIEGARLVTVDHPGPTTLLCGPASTDEILRAAQITAGYSDGRHEPSVRVRVNRRGRGGQEIEILTVVPAPRDGLRALAV